VVNDEALTFSEYQARYNRELLQNQDLSRSNGEIDIEVLRALIDERVQAQVARERGLTVRDEEVDNVVANMAKNNNRSTVQLYVELNDRGITEIQFRRSLLEQILIKRIVDLAVNSRVEISTQEVDYHLQAHKELYTIDESYEISHLFVSVVGKSETEAASDQENVEEIRQALLQGLPFEKAVKDFSDGDKENGGLIGWRKEDQLPDLFLDSLRDTPIGGITDVIRSENGFHILKIHSKEGDLKIVTQQRVRHILISPARKGLSEEEALTLAAELVTEIRAGADFSRIARLHSDDETSATLGGSLGWMNPGDTVGPFESAAQLLELNELSEPVKTQFGYHLIEVEDRRKKDISQELAKQQAYAEVYKRKQRELFQIWFGRIRDSAYIEMVAEL
jgi:peptidyl-prolyl cis-trans isomerase SurA